MERVIETIKAIRQRRTEMNVPPSRKAKVFISSKSNLTIGEFYNIKITSVCGKDMFGIKNE